MDGQDAFLHVGHSHADGIAREIRLEKCPYGETKPTCANCPIHCYQPHRREQIKKVMAYAGPRMLLTHPILAIRHMLDGRREAPPLPGRRRG